MAIDRLEASLGRSDYDNALKQSLQELKNQYGDIDFPNLLKGKSVEKIRSALPYASLHLALFFHFATERELFTRPDGDMYTQKNGEGIYPERGELSDSEIQLRKRKAESAIALTYGTDMRVDVVAKKLGFNDEQEMDGEIGVYLYNLLDGLPEDESVKWEEIYEHTEKSQNRYKTPEDLTTEEYYRERFIQISYKFDFWAEARKFWRPDAKNLVNLVDEGNRFILAWSHRGTGKSEILELELETVGKNHGYTVLPYQAGSGQTRLTDRKNIDKFKDEKLDPSKKYIVVIDESQIFVTRTVSFWENLRRVNLENPNVAFIFSAAPIAPYHQNLTSYRFSEKAKDLGITIETYAIQQRRLPADFVRHYYELLGIPDEVINFITDPKNSALLSPRIFQDALQLLFPGEYLMNKYSLISYIQNSFQSSLMDTRIIDQGVMTENEINGLMENLGFSSEEIEHQIQEILEVQMELLQNEILHR